MNRYKKTIGLSLLIMTLFSVSSYAQVANKPYNLQKAYEVLSNDSDEEQALKLLEEQIKLTPDNSEALLLRARIEINRNEFGKALSSLNNAIKVNKPRRTGIYNSSLYWWKASVYHGMDEIEEEIVYLKKALELARKDNKASVQSISFALGQAYYLLCSYDESDAVYQQMLSEDETDQAAMAGLALNMIAKGEYEAAIKLMEKCQKYGEDYSPLYDIKYQAYDKLGETDKAIDNALIWYEKDDESEVEDILPLLMKHRNYAVANAQRMLKTSENPDYWHILLIAIYEESSEYEKAIKEYDALENEFGKDAYIYYNRADCYDELGLTDLALSDIDNALAMGSTYARLIMKGGILRAAGRYSEAIEAFDKAIEMDPSYCYAYYARGWCYELSGDDDMAKENYDLGIDIDGSYAYTYLMRGEIYQKRGDTDKAAEDFRKVLQIDTTVEDSSCRQYALFFLGQEAEAEQWMQQVIDNHPKNSGNYYDKACLFTRMGRYDEAVAALGKALDLGYCKFAHIEHDDDLDDIRDRDDFQKLITSYRKKYADRLETIGIELNPIADRITEVPIIRRNSGTYDITCEINGLSLTMVFDTGASDVSISKVEADFMLKNNYLSASDIKGKQYYQTADGGISEGTTITLREVKIGDAVLHNVDASVVKSQKAPLLFGESILQRFGTFTVDNINSKLVIKY